MADLTTIEWVRSGERCDAANDPNGNPDIFNRPNRTIYAVLANQHNDDGTHKLAEFMAVEQGSYQGDSVDGRLYSLNTSNLSPKVVIILARNTVFPVFKSIGMGSDETKELGTNAFILNEIQDMTQIGTLELGNAATVNATGTTYDYIVFGTLVAAP